MGDGTEEAVPAAFFDLTGALAADATDALTGAVSVIDPNEGEAFIAVSYTHLTLPTICSV